MAMVRAAFGFFLKMAFKFAGLAYLYAKGGQLGSIDWEFVHNLDWAATPSCQHCQVSERTKKNIPSSNNVLPRKNASPGIVSNSFAAILKSGSVNHNTVTESSPAIVLDDACIIGTDFSVLPLKALTGIRMAKIVRLRELADINEPDNCSLSCIRVRVRTKPYVLINDNVKIIIKGQLHWICVKEQEAWMPEFKTVMEDDTSPDEESERNNENDLGSDNEHVSETSFAHENVDEFQVNPKPSCNTVISEDSFGIYKILKRNKDATATEDNIPGNTSQPNPTMSGNKEKASAVIDKFQASGSILEVNDEFIKVGQTMGYNMDGCMKNIEAIIGDFNEVRFEHERRGSLFNSHGANSFNNFITRTGLIDLPLEGYSFTWAHKSASKMSKLDRFLISEGLLALFPSISALCLDKHLSDHRPILLRELNVDYGPTPFRFFHSWSSRKGFDKMVEDSWKNSVCMESNSIIKLKKKLQSLKSSIKHWLAEDNQKSNEHKRNIQNRLIILDKIFDQGSCNDDLIHERSNLLKELQDFNKSSSLDMAQKAKIRWAIEGDENSKFFHGIINKKRSQLAIHGVLADGDWIVEPSLVKNEFLKHFATRFAAPSSSSITFDYQFPNRLTPDQIEDLERNVSYEEIKRAVWDCGISKSPGLDGFTFEFYRKYWSLIDHDVMVAVTSFFSTGSFPPGCNSSFIALIPKSQEAKMVKDFCPISLIGSMYKIITNVLANRLSLVIPELVSDVQPAFVFNRHILDGPFIFNELLSWCKHKKSNALIFKIGFEKTFDSVRWDYLDVVLANFGFGLKLRSWIQGCLNSAMGSILVNGSPTSEFKFSKGLK
ncbi:RNA-directed DNA polymerase, eukaryota [Tanacetum coccineum]